MTGRAGGPVILGHEFSAEVVAVAAGVKNVRPGDRVTVNPLIYCGRCHYCRKGIHIMRTGSVPWVSPGTALLLKYCVFPEYSIHKLPDSVTDDMGRLGGALGCRGSRVDRSGLKIGDNAAIVGAGPIGLFVLQACKELPGPVTSTSSNR